MKTVEKAGKNVDEAVDLALKELAASIDDVEVEILEESSKGILGLLMVKQARVKVTLKENSLQRAALLLKNIFQTMDLEVTTDISENEKAVFINLEGPDLGILIGRRGETLDALQYLVNLSVNKNQEIRKKIIIDIEGYRNRREKTLKTLAHKRGQGQTKRQKRGFGTNERAGAKNYTHCPAGKG